MEVVRSALANVPGVSNVRMVGAGSNSPRLKGQIVQYTGNAKAEDVIAILHKKTALKVTLAKPAAPKE